jgi:phenylpyruvate tautomerase PptA (4-oxalocrotonate tautomerase family)
MAAMEGGHPKTSISLDQTNLGNGASRAMCFNRAAWLRISRSRAMPFYTCVHKDGVLTDQNKRAIAEGITDIHCGLTGAPRHFVHVLFQRYEPRDCYTGGEPSRVANIRGSVRLGRSQETKEKLLHQITELWSKVCPGSALGDIVVSLAEVPGSNVMEGGVLLPHPKDDDTWLVNNGFQASAPAAA